MFRSVISGAGGRMGRLLIGMVLDEADFELAGAVEAAGSPAVGQDAGVMAGRPPCGVSVTVDFGAAVAGADVAIEFAAPDCALEHARMAAEAGCAFVLGTTALPPEAPEVFAQLAEDGARIFCAPNMSVGVNLLFYLCRRIVPVLGDAFDIEVVEMHHNRKKDAPSGTAMRLGEILAEAAGLPWPDCARHGRVGMTGERTKREIGMHAVRGGDVVGDHTVIFAGRGERIELTHRASSRETFARGALRAARFIAEAEPGVYDMEDVLGFRGGTEAGSA